MSAFLGAIYVFLVLRRDVLRRNGTAVDAAVATLFCNGAVHSFSLGLGGGFIMTIHSGGEFHSLMAREVAPAAASATMFVNASKGASSKGDKFFVRIEISNQ